MTQIDFIGLKLDVCPQCAGIWFDDGELSALSKGAPDAMHALDENFKPQLEILNLPEKLKTCPRCQQHLETFKYQYSAPIEIDSCAKCHGVFVEDQELSAIQEFIGHEDRVQITSAMEARDRLTEYKTGQIGNQDAEGGVSALLHALRHWRDKKDGKA